MIACISCPACGSPLRLPDAVLGQAVECPRCKNRWTAEADVPEPTEPREPSWQRRPEPGDLPDEDRDDHDRSGEERDEDEDEDEELTEVLLNPPRRDWLPHRGGLVLTVGVISLCLSAVPPVGFLVGLCAVVMASSDLAAMRRNEMEPDGHSLTLGGLIAGIVGVCLSLVILAVCAGFWSMWTSPRPAAPWVPGGPGPGGPFVPVGPKGPRPF
jgi:hypothetical protein